MGQQLLTWEGGTISSSESDSSLESSLLSTAGGAGAGAEVSAFFTFVVWGTELVFAAGKVQEIVTVRKNCSLGLSRAGAAPRAGESMKPIRMQVRDPGYYQATYQLLEALSVLQETPLHCQTSHCSHFLKPGFSRCLPLLFQAAQL